MAWVVQNNTERENILFTPLEKTEDGKYKLDNFDDVESLVATYNQRLYHSEKQQLRKMVIKYNHLFIEHYKEDTVSIIRTIKNLTQNGIAIIPTWQTIGCRQPIKSVSIHKAQGLEYDHVKIIITDEIDELITHSIFYTAITRARNSLKIYWTQPVEEKVLAQIKPQDHQKDVALLRQEIK